MSHILLHCHTFLFLALGSFENLFQVAVKFLACKFTGSPSLRHKKSEELISGM